MPFGGDILGIAPLSQGGGVTVGVYADKVRIATVGTANRVKRLPAGFKATKWEVDVYGDIAVEQITIATNMDQLKALT